MDTCIGKICRIKEGALVRGPSSGWYPWRDGLSFVRFRVTGIDGNHITVIALDPTLARYWGFMQIKRRV